MWQARGGGLFLSQPHLHSLMSTNRPTPQILAFKVPLQSELAEASLNINHRTVVQDNYVQNGERYSGIVKVTAQFLVGRRRKFVSLGSGVIIDERHVMTVGHVVWSMDLGLPVSIRIDKDSRADPNGLDCRYVEAGAVHFQWADMSSTQNDFAVLRVSTPFHNTKPMEVQTTPTTENALSVDVLGFSTDMPIAVDGEWLGYLCSSQSQVRYVPSAGPLLDHYGDTEKGASGGPVVWAGRVIALHRGWGFTDSAKCNKAVAINHHGNDLKKFINAIAITIGNTPLEGSQLTQVGTFMFKDSAVLCFG
ncbi:trypsin-like cysteine/serine peptidase domain-containing protein [Hypoxylon sp. FL1857]|nr:trypsin-like cysteine/serine peptidase domain-containing protein [Hypoxylon sp. FL1857]